MPKDHEVLTGEVRRFQYANDNRPAKLIVAGAEETFELTIFPENGVEQPWDDSSKLPSFMDSLPGGPLDIAGTIIQAIAEPRGEYKGVKKYKPSKITVLDNPGPKAAAPAAPAAATPAQAPKYLNPTDRDTLIVDQVIFKGAIDLLRGDTTVAKAVENAIAAWEGVRARHLPTEEILESEDDFGSL